MVDNQTLIQDKNDSTYDKLGKCRRLIDFFLSRFQVAYNCDWHLACDEIMVPYKGRRCNIKKYMKDKLVKYDIKVWCCTSSKSHNVFNLIVYEGQKGLVLEKDLGEKVVLMLVKDLTNRGHVVVID